jgi:uncharacterized protein with HEPN domain
MRDDRERLEDILDAIARIEKYSARGREAFESDELIQTWVVQHLQIIGEAASRVSDEMQSAHPEIAWANIVAMRNIIVHEYFGVDRDEVWSTVEFDLPTLKRQVKALLK